MSQLDRAARLYGGSIAYLDDLPAEFLAEQARRDAEWNAGMARLKGALAEWDASEAALAQAHMDLAHDLRGLIEGVAL